MRSFPPIRYSTAWKSLNLLSSRDRLILGGVTAFQVAFSFLDLVGIAIVGIIGSLTIRGVQSSPPSPQIQRLLNILNLEDATFQHQVAWLGLIAAAVLVTRTIVSIYTTRKILLFLSRRAAVITSRLLAQLLNQPITYIQQRSSQEILFILTEGVRAVTLGVVANVISLATDSFLLIFLFIGLLAVDPLIAVGTITMFLVVGLILYRQLQVRAHKLGYEYSSATIDGNKKILEVLSTYRENFVRNRTGFYIQEISKNRNIIASNSAEMAFMPSISKYVIESTLVVGGFIISALQFMLNDSAHAIGTLSIFLAAGSRIAPALLRVQQEALTIRNSSGTADPALKLIDELSGVESLTSELQDLDLVHQGFSGDVVIKDISYAYPNSTKQVISNFSLKISSGQLIAIVGPSGAGKTTLVDLLLGILEPATGTIRISGKSPSEAVHTWPGAISYVPQDVKILDGSIAENIALGYEHDSWNLEQVSLAIHHAHLSEVVHNSENGLHTRVGEAGSRMSGGQRQRIGVARSLYTNPQLLVMDEATSALDAESELFVTEAIKALKRNTTIVVIAHRLSTIRDADLVVYIENGECRASGTFEEVRKEVPNFDRQSKLMGL